MDVKLHWKTFWNILFHRIYNQYLKSLNYSEGKVEIIFVVSYILETIIFFYSCWTFDAMKSWPSNQNSDKIQTGLWKPESVCLKKSVKIIFCQQIFCQTGNLLLPVKTDFLDRKFSVTDFLWKNRFSVTDFLWEKQIFCDRFSVQNHIFCDIFSVTDFCRKTYCPTSFKNDK